MQADNIKYRDLELLVCRAVDGTLTQDQMSKLNQMLADDDDAVKHYVDFLEIQVLVELNFSGTSEISMPVYDRDVQTLKDLWHQLSLEEQTAPALELPEAESERELIQKVIRPVRRKRKVSKFQILSFISSAAAILCIIFFSKFLPPQPYSVEVATLVDQVDVKWSDSRPAMKNGTRLWTNESPYVLEEGIVSILYDNNVNVVIESPAKFQLEQSDIRLEYGRLFSSVPETGLGFGVETPTCKFIDLGTEFGVQADVNGSSELHVVKGQVQFFAGSDNQRKTTRKVDENSAVRYNNGRVMDIPIQKTAFAREVISTSGFVWRGQDSINLADIVGGGDGFGTGSMGRGIDVQTGRATDDSMTALTRFGSDGNYHIAAENPYVDGVFIPGGTSDAVQISSTGLNFTECPPTQGTCNGNVYNGAWHIHADGERPHLLKLDGRTFEKSGQALYMHSNMGVTFDLKALRDDMPGFEIDAFTATAGVSQTVLEKWAQSSRVDFWVLVDGQVKLKRFDVRPEDKAFEIDIDLSGRDRFLTIITTDSGAEYDGTSRDWALLAHPVLTMKTNNAY